MASEEFQARSELTGPCTGYLVQALCDGDASKSALALSWIVRMQNVHVWNTEVIVVEDVDEGHFKPLLCTLLDVEGFRDSEVAIDGSRTLDDTHT